MKKLKKILLINWLYFSKEIIEVGDVNFLTGKNGAGKSTVIDALQIVLLGETNARNFNQAANEKSQRTLDGYLRADMDENNPYSRRGKDFSSYIACEFLDETEGTSFVTGVVFDCRSDGSKQERFFIYVGTLPENCFIENGEAMEIPILRRYLKQHYTKAEIYDSSKCFSDTKYFERNIRDLFLRIARKYDNALALACEENNLGEKEQLAFLGIYARPEHYELAGNCLIRTHQGELDLNAAGCCGLALPSTLIESIAEIEMSSIDCITFIENKTNYDEYIASEKQSGELVIYHGGFLSPQKRRLFTLIANGVDAKPNVRFWADIDKGGFQMFQQLQELIPDLVPMRMSGEFVDKFHEHGLARSKEYLSALETDLKNGKYLLFQDAIEKILSYGVTIEQEAFLN